MGSCLSTTTPDPARHPAVLQPPPPKKIHHHHPPTWLDQLPAQVSQKIAYFVTNGQPSLDALRLAETGPPQARAVLHALQHSFSNPCLDGLEARWAGIFRKRIRQICVTSGFYEGCSPLLRLLTAPCLRDVTLCGEDRVIRALAESASVRRLTLSVSGDTSFHTLAEMLYRLNVTHLTLICLCVYDDDECPFRAIEDGRYVTAFAEACTNLEYLVIDCDHVFQEHPMWTLLKVMPSVNRTTINIDPPEELIPRLRRFKSVEIGSNVTDWRRLVDRIGPAVTLLETYSVGDDPGLIRGVEDLKRLRKCPNIDDLEICIENAVEEGLLDVLSTFEGLKRLAVRWVHGNTSEHVGPYYYAPAPGIIPKLVEACPKLTKLCLRCVRFSVKEQDAVLRILGSRLEEVEVSFNGQTQHAFDRVEAFLRSAIKHTHGLRKIELVEENRSHRLCRIGAQPDLEVIEKQRARLLHLLSILRRWAPGFDDSEMRDYIAKLAIPEDPGVETTVHHEDGFKIVHG